MSEERREAMRTTMRDLNKARKRSHQEARQKRAEFFAPIGRTTRNTIPR